LLSSDLGRRLRYEQVFIDGFRGTAGKLLLGRREHLRFRVRTVVLSRCAAGEEQAQQGQVKT
jgi:hypothetical protein